MDRRGLLARIVVGSTNVSVADMVSLVLGFGFRLARVTGAHHIVVHPDMRELTNLQAAGGQAKPYQVR
jgi:predicted RNA binding protein YcfA (HicA-like mRNA interferase family)